MSNKYELAKDLPTHKGLFRIRALKDFGDIKAGDIGGYVASKNNLSQEGNAWVYGDARVYGNARVFGNARVYGDAEIHGDATVCGDARVYGDARVCGDAEVDNPQGIICLTGLQYNTTLTKQCITIGCRAFTLKELRAIKKKQAVKMGLDARNFTCYKKLILLAYKEVK